MDRWSGPAGYYRNRCNTRSDRLGEVYGVFRVGKCEATQEHDIGTGLIDAHSLTIGIRAETSIRTKKREGSTFGREEIWLEIREVFRKCGLSSFFCFTGKIDKRNFVTMFGQHIPENYRTEARVSVTGEVKVGN